MVQFATYNLDHHPPQIDEIESVTPIHEPTDTEMLSPELLHVPDRARRMGLLATKSFLDLTRFQLNADEPPDSYFFIEYYLKNIDSFVTPPSVSPTYLGRRDHLGAATRAFRAVCLSPHVLPDPDISRIELGYRSAAGRTSYDFITNPPDRGYIHNILVSRLAVAMVQSRKWQPGKPVGPAQQRVLDRIIENSSNPYTDFDTKQLD